MEADEANFGITGTLMARAGMNRNDGKSFLDRLDLVLNSDFVMIFGGTNDYFWSDMPIGDENSREDCFYVAVDQICKKCSKVRDVKKTLIVTPYPHNGIGNFYGGENSNDSSRHDTCEINYNGHRLIDYVNVLEQVASKYGIPVLNLHTTKGFNWKKHTSDGCHPNSEGHYWIAEQIQKVISVLL